MTSISMENKLKRKFTLVATLSVFVVLVIVLGIINIISFANVKKEVYAILNYIAENEGVLPFAENEEAILDRNNNRSQSIFLFTKEYSISEEGKYEVRYFSATTDKEGNVVSLDTSHIAAVTDMEAGVYAKLAVRSPLSKEIVKKGYYDYGVMRKKLKNGYLVIFVDCTRQISNVYVTMKFSIYIGITALLLFFIVLSILAKRAIAPIINNMEAQKQFITNASHELKTPLAVIKANTEVIEMLDGKNEWTESTSKQVTRLTELIGQLVTLSKLQEKDAVKLTDVDFTKEVKDVCQDFNTVASQESKKFESEIAEGVRCNADEKGLHELISILIDNATKYCDSEGTVKVTLVKRGKTGGVLTVSNSYKNGEGVDYDKFFERFYREEKSHNQEEKKGYGIGLSMAQNLTELFRGKIKAAYKDGVIRFIVTL